MNLLVGPSSSGYGGEPSTYNMGGLTQEGTQEDPDDTFHYQDVDIVEHPSTQDPGDFTQEHRVDDVQQAPEHILNFFFSRFSGVQFVRRSRRDNREKRRDPLFCT